MYKILETQEYVNWLESLSLKELAQVQARVSRIILFGHFGDARKLGSKLAELKWRNGRRVYFAFAEIDRDSILILLLGGNKNGQQKDIDKARAILRTLIQDE